MISTVVVDTGPLVALVNSRDQRHEWVRTQLGDIAPPLLTCEPVITEACFLARRTHGGAAAILGLMERGVVELAFVLKDQVGTVSAMMRQYAKVPMSLADACLVRMSEIISGCVVLTLDGDFRIYRRHRRQKIPLLLPPEV